MAMAASSRLPLPTAAYGQLGAIRPSAEQISSLSPWHKPATSRSYIPNACSMEISYSPSTSLTPVLTMNKKVVFRLSASSTTTREEISEDEVAEEEGFSEAQREEKEKEEIKVNEPKVFVGTKVFVANLPYSCDSAELAGIVQEYGRAEMVEVIYDRNNGRSRGFAFVTMSTVEDANAVIENLDGSNYGGRTLRVEFKGSPMTNRERTNNSSRNREHAVFVGNLSRSVNTETLREVFSACGNVLRARIVNDFDGISRGYGFVSFSSQSEVEVAVAALNGMELDGREIYLDVADARRNSL